MISAALAELAATETYTEVRQVIFGTVKRFHSRYGGDIQELRSEALEHYVAAYRSYDNSKGSFSNRVAYKVWMGLMDSVKKKSNRNRVLSPVDFSEATWQSIPSRERHFSVEDLNLSPDAVYAVNCALHPPIDMRLIIAQHGEETPYRIRLALIEFLVEVGWSKKRIFQVFEEIRNAI